MSSSRRKPYVTEEPVTAHELLETSPFENDLDAELAARPERRRTSKLTMVLAGAVLLVAGVVVGIQLQKFWGVANARQAALQGLLAGAGGGQRAGGGRFGPPGAGQGQGQGPGQGQGQGQGRGAGQGGAFANVTVGTIKLVDGGKIYLETTGGGIVTVRTSGDTKVQVSKEGKVKDLKPGSTIVVQGQRGSDGSVTATSVNQGGGGAGGFGGGRP